MVAVTIALVVVAVVVFLAAALGELSWLSDVRRRRDFYREQDR